MNHRGLLHRLSGAALAFACLAPVMLRAQRTPPPQVHDPMTAKLIDSRKGYVARIPEEAVLDSTASGWSPSGMFERRVYRIKGAGAIRFTVTVKPLEIPQNATVAGGYTLMASDSATSSGTAKVRTYYLPSRTVRIELIPAGAGMQRYLDAYETIFNSFRWKPGAASNTLDIP